MTTSSCKTRALRRGFADIPEKTISEHFANNAIAEKKEADRLRNGAVACMFLLIFVLIYTFLESHRSRLEAMELAIRIALSLAFSIPSAYLARESARHREEERRCMQLSLEFKSLDPYLGSLPDTEQHRIKAAIADRVFGMRQRPAQGVDAYPVDVNKLFDLCKDALAKLPTGGGAKPG